MDVVKRPRGRPRKPECEKIKNIRKAGMEANRIFIQEYLDADHELRIEKIKEEARKIRSGETI